MWVFNKNSKNFEYRSVTIVPGLYKIFDEILVNAADNKIRDPSMDTIKVTIDSEKNEISVYNNGKGIPVEIHEKEKVYIPELIFGHLLTSSNYDDNEKKVTGGRNGYGAKLCNIFSTEFIVETSDKNAGKKFKQVFNDNMSKRSKPKLTNATKDDFTKITFKPDLKKFGMEKMDEDFEALLLKRVYDIAGCVSGVKVYLNDERIKIKNFKDYCQMYINSTKKESDENDLGNMPNQNPNIIYERVNERWEIAFAMSDGQFQQVSFVNSICTIKGGTHVNYVSDQITSKLIDSLKRKNKSLSIKPFQVKNHLWVFINCLIENPAFDSQTKETLTLRASSFGSKCPVSDNFINKVLKSGVIDNILTWAKYKQSQMLKKTDGHKRSRISGIPKLDDANNAGTKHSKDCVLILTEGDSAKALAISGLTVVGRDNYGVFPLRGKMLNVRDASHKSIMDNAEVSAIKQILGLQHGKVYENTDSLRYGHIMIMADQDTDGSHIKGLVINFLDHFWPSLLKIPGFLLEFITPIVKVSRKGSEISFYTLPEYEKWKEDTNNGKGWKIKYYKGLGTSVAADAKKYFSDMQHHCKKFSEIEQDDRKLLDMAFSKKNADKRKDWLKEYRPDIYMDNSVDKIAINEFINKELIQFSMADVIRSIPSLVDGLKPGQRKIIYGCFKRNLTNEIKVAQLTGYVAEHSAYHHGEQSLQTTIVNLAQDFVGSNNIPLLVPNGQFGTRLQGGKDAASARYIFTYLSKITRLIFKKADDNIITYLNDDGQMIEPNWYIPILPMVLINGAEGIGTGYSTNIPNFNPRDVVMNLKRRIRGLDFITMHPWYRGFRGKIEKIDENKYKVSGEIHKVDDTTIEITELPIRCWTQTCKEMLESFMTGTEKQPPIIKDYKEYHTDTSVHFRIFVSEANMKKLEEEGLEKKFKITNIINLTNMHLFDPEGKIKKYQKVEDIMEEFYNLRIKMYQKRKEYLMKEFENELLILNNKVRFIMEIINGTLVINRKKRVELVKEMISRGYDRVYPKGKTNETTNEEEEEVDDGKGYEYLLSMQFWSLTLEKVEKLKAERDAKKEELDYLKAQAIEDLWLGDLDDFLDEWDKIEHEFDSLPRTTFGTNAKKEKPKRRSRKSTKVKDEDDATTSNTTSYQTNGDDSDDDYNPGKINVKKKASRTKSVQSKLSFGSVKKEDEQENNLSNLLSKTSSSSSLSTLDNDLTKVKLEDNSELSISSKASSTKKVTRKLKRIKLEEDSTFKKPSNTLTNWLNPSSTSSSKSVDPMDIEISSVKEESDNEISGSSRSSSTSSRRSSKKRKIDDDDFLMDDGEESENDENNEPIKSPIGRRLRTSSRLKKTPKYTFDDDDDDDDEKEEENGDDATLNDDKDDKDEDYFDDIELPELKSKNSTTSLDSSSSKKKSNKESNKKEEDEKTENKEEIISVEVIDADKDDDNDIEIIMDKKNKNNKKNAKKIDIKKDTEKDNIKNNSITIDIDDNINKNDDVEMIKDDNDDDLSIKTGNSGVSEEIKEIKELPKSRVAAMRTKRKSKSEDNNDEEEEESKKLSKPTKSRSSRTYASKRRSKIRDIQYLELSDDD
ncbi:type II DNA topoisomerase [Anaeromyces robustus]|uniref:DNA topoisomerase 2 n=1 Tax=Anaeromyces robustus TaxID=1754192 RepID=A0A1Y1WR74_9FUNG|nr:type II DNA topoisomerase [Anaeromyces robustus]|eukprot:ORX76043.1 type II DNA topoisomerase [Anaeromyces robustus]